MPGIRPPTAAASLAVVLIATSPTAAAQRGVTSGATAVQAPAPVQVRADVDGDGRLDRVSVSPSGQRLWTVQVKTAKGVLARLIHSTRDFVTPADGNPWFGAAHIDGAPGRELVLQYGYGAHVAVFGVYTWRHNRLRTAPEPANRSAYWAVDAYAGGGRGYTSFTKGPVRYLHVTEATADWEQSAPRYTASQQTFTWSKGAWKPGARHRFPITVAQTGRYLGWHIRGLPQWPAR